MTALTALIRKDLLIFLSDRRALLLTLMMPVVLGAFFGFLFGGSGSSQVGTINIGLVQLDQSDTSLQIAASLKADTSLQIRELSQAEAETAVRKGKSSAAIIIPKGFGDAAAAAFFGRKEKPVIQIYYDPSQSTTLAMLKGILTQHTMQHVSANSFNGTAGQKVIDDSLKEIESKNDPNNTELKQLLNSVKKFQNKLQSANQSKQANPDAPRPGLSMPFTTQDQALSAGPQYNGYGHAFGGMSVQFILFMGIDIGIGILLLRRQGIWNRILTAPVSLETVILARALSATILSFGLLLFIFMFAIFVFKVEMAGSWLGFLGISLSFSLMSASFGLLIAAFGKTPEAARGIAVFVTLTLVMLGGAWIPSFIFPSWLQTITLITPTRWAVDGLDAMTWRGLGIEAALPGMVVLLAYALLMGSFAIWKFKREQA
jgi:ABC-2 type transport system permease protein